MAEDCLPDQPIEGLFWRNPTLKLGEAAAIYDSDSQGPNLIDTTYVIQFVARWQEQLSSNQ